MSTTHAKAFDVDPRAGFHVDLHFLCNFTDRGHIAYAYRYAADTMVEAVVRRDRIDDALYLPIAFNYRHSLESYLKEFLETACQVLREVPNSKLLGTHSLIRLWEDVKPRLKRLNGDADEFKIADAIIAEFDRVDPNGETFRYIRGKDGKSSLSAAPAHVDVSVLKGAVDPVLDFFAAIEEMLNAMFDGISDEE